VSNRDDSLVDELRRPPRSDPRGNVDVEQIRYNLSLTPAERLTQLEQFIQFVTDARRRNDIE
jgi:hypothetical protein